MRADVRHDLRHVIESLNWLLGLGQNREERHQRVSGDQGLHRLLGVPEVLDGSVETFITGTLWNVRQHSFARLDTSVDFE